LSGRVQLASEEDRRAARVLADLAATEVGRAPGKEAARSPLRWLTRGRRVGREDWPDDPEPDTPWRDTRSGWRERAAYLDGEEVFAADYEVCRPCGLAWVEEPYTHPDYQRCGLAAAALAALRSEYPGLEWHTLGGHFRDTEPFWSAVGAGIDGGYTKRDTCPHGTVG
jgi:GNAT superfamily N-acetyltransferase